MNVTTQKSECDHHQERRQLEVALEHAKAAGLAAVAKYASQESPAAFESATRAHLFVEVRYPTYRFRDALRSVNPRSLRPDGRWDVLTIAATSEEQACKAACSVLRHYYPEEDFGVGVIANEVGRQAAVAVRV